MIRFIVFITKIFVATAIAILLNSCQLAVDLGNGIKGNGKVTTEIRNSDADFTSVEVNRGLEVELSQSGKKSITVVADSNLQQHISTKISNGVLTITCDDNIKSSESNKIIVAMPKIDALQTSSAAEIKGKNTFKSDNLILTSSSGSEMEIAVEGDNLKVQASSGSNITLNGKVLRLETNGSSGSVIDAEKMMSNDIVAEGSSGSNTDVYPLVSLNANASSGASIAYHNMPKNKVKQRSSSSGSVSKE